MNLGQIGLIATAMRKTSLGSHPFGSKAGLDLRIQLRSLVSMLADQFVQTNSNRHTPIIAFTASAMKEAKERCLESGMDDYIPKPFNLKNRFSITARHASKTSDKPNSTHRLV